MKILIVEDDFISRCIIKEILSPYGTCEIAVDGREALDMFKTSLEKDSPYDLICLDFMMPEMNGQNVLKSIRGFEAVTRKTGSESVKIVMTTALGDEATIRNAFRDECNGYLVKPISKTRLLETLKGLGLLK